MKKELICNTQYIDYYLQKHKISKYKFAKECGISIYILNKIYNQNKNVDSIHILPIVKKLNISLNTFLFLENKTKQST